ncbi:hypothetical protein Dsin_018910 [Dipteronia sinensis]|uniref:RNase H type-1 domain-containing protein n=1 Tax=Dipteronia sinensis TaxID=43782 RepID=A0AAE0A715_9ROSI|nr:hypothetical protein Dsin_018910 [Dipteronia sinensis]
MNEKSGGSDKSISEMLVFRQAVDDCDLIDLGFHGPMFTWNNKRDGRNNIQERLDRILVDHQWTDKFPQARVDNLGFYSSDHRPLLLTFSSNHINYKGKNKGFRFKSFWLREDDIGSRVGAESGFFDEFRDLSVTNVLAGLLSRVGKDKIASICIIAWTLWENRNAILNGGRTRSPEALASWAESFLSEFQGPLWPASRREVPLRLAIPGDWIPPSPGLLKLNSGVAIRKGVWATGVGSTIRDDKGGVLAALSKPLTGPFQREVGEFLALREGLLLAKAHCLSIQIAEVAVPQVASVINSPNTFLGDASFIINDIKGLFTEVSICMC